MFRTTRPLCIAASIMGSVVLLSSASTAWAQEGTSGFITGEAARAWEKWEAAMQAILARDADKSEAAFGELLAMNPSPFRIALLADYTLDRTAAGGAVMLFEQDLQAEALGESGRRVAELLESGREQKYEADDGFYFCQLGRFDVAEANFRALLDAKPDPVALLEFTGAYTTGQGMSVSRDISRRREILLRVVDNPLVGASAQEILRLLGEGELTIKADPTRIKENVERLAGTPRAFENATGALKDSGEYAIPFLIESLRDPANAGLLHNAILRCLPQIDRPALNPLVMALRMNDDVTKRNAIEALAKIGYAQAVPYLLQLVALDDTSPEVRQAAQTALSQLPERATNADPKLAAAEAFMKLAEDYYADRTVLAADPRLDQANVWYWREDLLQNVPVPTVIFNEIMAMRCCEEALLLAPGMRPAISLWLAANFRREAQLPYTEKDDTRPDNYPPGIYFAQSAGSDVVLAVLARAIDDGDRAVALGAIDALSRIAGPASLVGNEAGRLPLAEALSFPDRMVRIRAGLTLGATGPTQAFQNYQNLMPVLSEALTMHGGGRNALVVDPDLASANEIAGKLRSQEYTVLSDTGLFTGLQKVRDELPGLDVIVLASDIKDPGLVDGLASLRSEFVFATTPVVLVAKPGNADQVRVLVRADYRLSEVAPGPSGGQLSKAIALVSKAVGAQPITSELGETLALEAAQVLRMLGVTDNPLFEIADAEPALLGTLTTQNAELRMTVIQVLGYLGSSKAQDAIARIALDTAEPEDTRVQIFTSLAEAAKRRGNLLSAELVTKIVEVAERDVNLTIREAASRTLGALNVAGEPASVIIRNQHHE